MNAQAGPSRSQPSRPIDLSTIYIDKSIPNSFSSTSIAPSLSTQRSSTQSSEGWSALHTPRLDRLSLSISECSIIEDDVVIFGQGKDGKDRSIDSIMLDDGKPGNWWIDLDKTPKPSDPKFKSPAFPSRISSLPKQQPYQISPRQRSRPLATSPVLLDKPLPLLGSPRRRIDKALPPAPSLCEIDETDQLPAALPDDSPVIPACMLERYVPPIYLIPPFNPTATRNKLPLSTIPGTLAVLHGQNTISVTEMQACLAHVAGPPPPIPPRRSSRKERSGQSIPTDHKMVSTTSLVSLEQSLLSSDDGLASSTSLTSVEAPIAIGTKQPSSTSLPSLGQAPPLPPPRASSLRSAAARAANSPSPSTSATEHTRPKIEPLQSPLTRRPRVRSRSAQLPPTVNSPARDRQLSYSCISLSSILEDEMLPDMKAIPEGSWSLRRKRLRLARAKSQPRLRRKNEHGPWIPLGAMPNRLISLDLV